MKLIMYCRKNTKHKMSFECKIRLSASVALLTYAPVLDEDFKLAPLNMLEMKLFGD